MIQNADTKTGAVVWVDLKQSALGLRSRASDRLGGEVILNRTLRRLEGANRLDEILVFCPAGQQGQVSALVEGTKVVVCGVKAPVPMNAYVRRRKWSLSAWRGGLGAMTCFDEQSFTVEMVPSLATVMFVSSGPKKNGWPASERIG